MQSFLAIVLLLSLISPDDCFLRAWKALRGPAPSQEAARGEGAKAEQESSPPCSSPLSWGCCFPDSICRRCDLEPRRAWEEDRAEEDVRSMSRGREEELARRETCLVLHTSARIPLQARHRGGGRGGGGRVGAGKEVAGPDLRRLGSTAWHASGSRGRRGRAEQVLGQEAKTPVARGDGRSRREEGRRWRLKKGERNARFPRECACREPLPHFCIIGCDYCWSRNSTCSISVLHTGEDMR